MRVLNVSEVGQLLSAAESPQMHLFMHLAVETGMRQGELIALRWREVDLELGVIQVVRSARRYKGEGVVAGPTKTHRSARPVAVSDDTAVLLREHRKRQVEHRLMLGPLFEDNDLVFSNDAGSFLPVRTLNTRFHKAAKTAGLGPLRFHDLRHTAATLMLRLGTNPKVASERLGHSTVAFTLDTYSHVQPDMQRDAAEVISAALKAAR